MQSNYIQQKIECFYSPFYYPSHIQGLVIHIEALISPCNAMWLSFAAFAKLFCQIGLFVFFLYFFGIPNIKRYQQKEVMVVSSARKSGGILAPAIAVFPKNPVTRKGCEIEFLLFRQICILVLCSKTSEGPGNPLDITFLDFFGIFITFGSKWLRKTSGW